MGGLYIFTCFIFYIFSKTPTHGEREKEVSKWFFFFFLFVHIHNIGTTNKKQKRGKRICGSSASIIIESWSRMGNKKTIK
jgi:hypothetical protein